MKDSGERRLARVLDIQEDTWVTDEDDHFHFVSSMTRYIGMTIRVKRWGKAAHWYQDVKTAFVYHDTWLSFLEG